MFVRSFVVVMLSTTALANAATFVVTERPQTQASQPADASAAPAGAAPAAADPSQPAKPAVDESALRYYARHNQVDRMEAEIRRLRTLYPDWQVPDDLSSDKPYAGEEQPLWDLYAQNKLPELERAIAERVAHEPGWQPSPDLESKIHVKEVRAQLMKAADAGQWDRVIDLAASQPAMTDCSDVEVLWRLAEAYNGTAKANRSEDVYRYILNNCSDAGERTATVRRALSLLGIDAARRLIPLGAPHEFDAVENDILAARIAAVVSGKSPDDLTEDEKMRATDLAEGKHDYGFMTQLGWYAWARNDGKTSLKWFQMAMAAKGKDADPKVVEGVVLALHDLARNEEALKIAHDWYKKEVGIENLYIGLMVIKLSRSTPQLDVTEADLADYNEVVTRRKAPNGASALGWYAFNLHQYDTAENWFNLAVEWAPDSVRQAVDAHQDAGGDARVAVLIARLASNVAGMHKYELSDSDRALLEEAAKKGDATITGLLGWYERKRGNIETSYSWFQAGLDIPGQQANPAFIEGVVLSLWDLGHHDEALQLLNKWKNQSANLMVDWINLTASRLTSDDPSVQVSPEELNEMATEANAAKSGAGANALGWYAFHQEQFDRAAIWFKQSMLWLPSESAAIGQVLAAFRLGDKDAAKQLAQTYAQTYAAVGDLDASLLPVLDPTKAAKSTGEIVITTPAQASAQTPAQASAQTPAQATARTKVRAERHEAGQDDETAAPATRTTYSYGGNSSAIAAKNRGDYAGCISILAARGSLSPADALTYGWCNMQLHQDQQALDGFERALAGGRGAVYADAAYGKSLALLRLGMSNSAAQAAAGANLSVAHKREIGIAVLSSQAVALYNNDQYREALAVLDERARYIAEPANLSMLRGWSLYHLGYWDEARQVFTYVNSVFPNREAVSALAIVNRTNYQR